MLRALSILDFEPILKPVCSRYRRYDYKMSYLTRQGYRSMEKHSAHHSHHHPHPHNHVVDGPTSRRDFLRVLMGGALAGASISGACLASSCLGPRGGSQFRAQPLRHSEGCRRRLLCACPSSGHVELQRRHIRPFQGRSRCRCALQAIGCRFSDRPDEAGSYHQAGALRDQHPLSRRPHARRSCLSFNRRESRLYRQLRPPGS